MPSKPCDNESEDSLGCSWMLPTTLLIQMSAVLVSTVGVGYFCVFGVLRFRCFSLSHQMKWVRTGTLGKNAQLAGWLYFVTNILYVDGFSFYGTRAVT